jgi:hypothetical protein
MRSARAALILVAILVAACSSATAPIRSLPAHDPIILVVDSTNAPAYFSWRTTTSLNGSDTVQSGTTACVKFVAVDSIWIDYRASEAGTNFTTEVGPRWLYTPNDTMPPYYTAKVVWSGPVNSGAFTWIGVRLNSRAPC